MSKIDTEIRHTTAAGGNIFADLGHSPEEASKLKIKAQLMVQIHQWIKKSELTEGQSAEILGVSRPRVSDVTRGKIGKFTIDALVDMVEKTGHHVTLEVA